MSRDVMLIMSGMGLGALLARKQGQSLVTNAIGTVMPALGMGGKSGEGEEGKSKEKDDDDFFKEKKKEEE